MKKTYLLILILIIFIGCKSTEESISKNSFSNLDLKNYSEKELISDFNLLINSLKEAHTGLYWYSTELEFDSIVELQKSKIRNGLNGLEFYNILAPVISFVKEDHTDIYLSDSVVNFMKRKGKFLPLAVKELNKKIFILNNPTEKINIQGYELKEINGKPIDEIYSTLFETFASDGYIKTSKYRWLDGRFLSKLYARTIGQADSFQIKVINPNTNKTFVLDIPSTSKTKLFQIPIDFPHSSKNLPADFEILSNKIGILTFNTFYNPLYEEKGMNFKKFVAKSFKKIDSLNIKNLIIDIRQNGGGNEGNEDYLFSFLTNKPYQKYKYVELSAFSYSFYEHTDYKKDYLELEKSLKEEHYLAGDGRILRKRGIEKPEPIQENPFLGNIYVLTSGVTYSGGAEFASLVRQHTNATFIGEEVGGGFYGNTSGYIFTLTLPNTGISVDIPLLKFVLDVDKEPFGRGVIPDYKIQPTIEEYLNGYDKQMNFTIELIE